jgi:two-component system sensor histidine kinase KdpD
VRETVPDWVIKQATEIQFVDATPEALLNRLRRGAVYTGDMAQTAVERFFRESNLRALREIAMREAAHEVQARQSESTVESPAREEAPTGMAASDYQPGASRERILLVVTADATTAMLIRRARRVADYLHGDCLAVYVDREKHFGGLSAEEREKIERHLNFARNLRIETRVLEGQDTARTVVEFARRNHVTQVFLSRALLGAPRSPFKRSLIHEIVHLGHDMQITVVCAQRGDAA